MRRDPEHRIDLLDADARAQLHAFAADAFQSCSVQPRDMRPVLVVGDAWRSILHASTAADVGLVVMGTRGLGGVQKLLLGSTAQRVVRGTGVPLLLVPQDDRPASTGDPTVLVKHVLAATDFGPSSKAAVHAAAELAKELASDLLLVNVVKPVAVAEQWQHYVNHFDEEHLARARAHLARDAHELLDEIRECSYAAALGEPAEAIATLSRERSSGLIVMGLANRHDFEGARPGSVAYGVVRAAHIPVLVVPRTSDLAEQPRPAATQGQMMTTDAKVAP